MMQRIVVAKSIMARKASLGMGADPTSEWLFRLPGIDQLWSATKGAREIRVAVLDGPVAEATMSAAELAPAKSVQHGTLVASIISGSSDGSVSGLAPGCTVISVQIFREPLSPETDIIACTQDELSEAIMKAVSLDANIINVSAAQQESPLGISSKLTRAIEWALDKDVLIVAAAGNHGCPCDVIPASAPGVLAVGAHDGQKAPLLMSNWGLNQRAEGILAPGVDIPGACAGGGVCRGTGTSFASAVVSGVSALLMSVDFQLGRRPSGNRLKKILLDSCDRCPPETMEVCGKFLAGVLNVSRATKTLLVSSKLGSHAEELMSSNTASPDKQERAEAYIVGRDRPSDVRAGGLLPADCGCDCGSKNNGERDLSLGSVPARPQLVYAIGRLGVSFTSQARRDSIWRSVNGGRQGDLKPITDDELVKLFGARPYEAQAVVWTLSRTEVPMYAIMPGGAFAADTYKWLVEEWSDPDVELISVPGVLAGQIALYDGMRVDVVVPDLRGMYSWENTRYSEQIARSRREAAPDMPEEQIKQEIGRFLGKIYFRLRNKGLAPEERALNAAATNAFNISDVIVTAGREGLTLRDVSVERSPLNRPGSNYYDVLATFFDPRRRTEVAPLLARFTIDVSDTVPVMIGDPVTWYEY